MKSRLIIAHWRKVFWVWCALLTFFFILFHLRPETLSLLQIFSHTYKTPQKNIVHANISYTVMNMDTSIWTFSLFYHRGFHLYFEINLLHVSWDCAICWYNLQSEYGPQSRIRSRVLDLLQCLGMTLPLHGTSDYTRIRTSHVFKQGIELELTVWKSKTLTTQPATHKFSCLCVVWIWRKYVAVFCVCNT